MPPRRFPPPWTVEDIGAAFVVKDSAGQKLAYVYFGDEPGTAAVSQEQACEVLIVVAGVPVIGLCHSALGET
jgi:hypothetical protein